MKSGARINLRPFLSLSVITKHKNGPWLVVNLELLPLPVPQTVALNIQCHYGVGIESKYY